MHINFEKILKDYDEIVLSVEKHGRFLNFSDEKYGKYKPTIDFLERNGYLCDSPINNANCYTMTESFPYFKEQILEHPNYKYSEQTHTPNEAASENNMHIHNIQALNISTGNNANQHATVTPQEQHSGTILEKYAIHIIVALITAIGMIISAIIQSN